jgi:hypothetical protein
MVLGAAAAVVAILLQAHWGLIAAADWRGHWCRWLLSVAIPYAAIVVPHLIWRFAEAPWRIHQELEVCYEGKTDELRAKLNASEAERAQLRGEHLEARRLHGAFGEFMSEGEELAAEFRRGMQEYGPWLQKRRDWVLRVSKALDEINLKTEASAFRHAGEKDREPVAPGTTPHPGWQFKFYMEQLNGYRKELEAIVKRSLPAIKQVRS